MMPKPWTASVPPTGKVRPDIHILPDGDLYPHQETRDCWCVPDLQVVEESRTVLVLHHAADGRELIESHGVQ
jgi:hypothetical protein